MVPAAAVKAFVTSRSIGGGIEVKLALNHWILVTPGERPRFEDCYYRMLLPHEVQLGMAFDADYIVLGNGKEKVKQLGNAVTPPAMQFLSGRCIETLK